MGSGAGDPRPDYKATGTVGETESESRRTVAQGKEAGGGLAFRRLATPEEFRAAEEVQRVAWGLTTDSPVPAPMLRALQDNGGLVLGAFSGATLIGVTAGFLGREEGRSFHYSHITGVRPDQQNRHVGLALKSVQRLEVLRDGLDEIRWTFDPIQAKNAFFNLRRLGGRPDRYYPNYYGPMGDSLNEGLETDRLRLIWSISDPHVESRLRGELPSAADDEARWRRSQALIETALGGPGLRRPASVRTPAQPEAVIEIPLDLANVRSRDFGGVRRWREAMREAFTAAFQAGYRVEDFAVVTVGGEKRAGFFLARAPREGDAA